MVTIQTVKLFCRRNGLEDAVLCLHASFRSFGAVEDGPRTIIDGFLAAGCTLLCPAFYYESDTFPAGANYANNGIDYAAIESLPAISFDGLPGQIDRSMGIVPRTMLEYPAAERSRNPLDSFAALGTKSGALLAGQDPLNVYSAYKRLVARGMKSFVVLAGTDLTACTPLHYAEERAGRRLFRRWAVHHGRTVEVEVGSCSDGFEKLAGATDSLETVDRLGESRVRMYPFREFIDRAAAAIRADPEITRCGDGGCLRCRDMIAGGRGENLEE